MTAALKLPTAERIRALTLGKGPGRPEDASSILEPPTAPSEAQLEQQCRHALWQERKRLGVGEADPRSKAGHCNRCGIAFTPGQVVHPCRRAVEEPA
jgi:hypothetical protein